MALPSTGKSVLTSSKHNLPCSFLDSDDILVSVFGQHGKHVVDKLMVNTTMQKLFRAEMRRYIDCSNSYVLLTNFDTSLIGMYKPIAYVGYTPKHYVDHIRQCNRWDLLEKFDRKTLLDWAASYVLEHSMQGYIVLLNSGTFISDLFQLSRGELWLMNKYGRRGKRILDRDQTIQQISFQNTRNTKIKFISV